ncbi:MAG TPA: hypothetical protein VLY82_03700 [Nitrososphaerales archaeon]|nr:hypothetical protein [Nitrososphaerales archaeon]
MKSNISPMWLTYYMMKWAEVEQTPSDQKCTMCGQQLMKTETITDEKGMNYEGYVCHADKQVTWMRKD